jgi:hypothetical protein
MPTKFNHLRYYSAMKDRLIIPKFHITSGMIINFPYSGGSDKRPLVFVMDTDEYKSPDKKNFSGVNLNYLPISEINNFFIKLLNRAGWELDEKTDFPKLDIWDEEDPGVRVETLYNVLVKKQLLQRGKDCWRTYKYSKVTSVHQIKFNFQISPLKEILDADFSKLDKIDKSTMYKLLRGKGDADKL